VTERDILFVQSQPPTAIVGRVLTKTPHEIGVLVAHREVSYGLTIETADKEGYVLKRLKQVIFQAVRDTITTYSQD